MGAEPCRRAVLVWGAVSALLSHACAPGVMQSDSTSRDGAAEVAITIANEMSRAMRIHLVAGSVDLPLGTVPPLATRTFLIPGGFAIGVSEFRIEARERGAEIGVRTETFRPGPDQVVVVALRRANTTTVSVRPRR
jgi:hypothetical protein